MQYRHKALIISFELMTINENMIIGGFTMTFKEFCKRYDNIKIKYDIIVLSELVKLYVNMKKKNLQ